MESVIRWVGAVLLSLGVASCAELPATVLPTATPLAEPTAETPAPPPVPTATESTPLPVDTPAAAPEPWEDPVLTVAYTRDGELWLAVGHNAPRQLTDTGDAASPLLSPDGRRLLFRRGEEAVRGWDGTTLWVLDLQDGGVRPLAPPAQELDAAGAAALAGRYPREFAWLADGHRVAFSTASPVEYGQGAHHDLWLADVEGEAVVQLLADGEGGALAPAPTGSAIMVAGIGGVTLVNADSGARQALLSYPPVNTASEWLYVPRPVWLPDGSGALLAVTSQDPWAADASCALWRLSADEGAAQMGALPVACLYDAGERRLWSPDGSRLAFIDEAQSYMVVAAGDGSDAAVYTTNASQFLGWSADGARFALRIGQAGDIYIGEMGSPPVPVADPGEVGDVWEVQWLEDGTLVYTTGEFSGPALWVAEPGAEPRVIDGPIGDHDVARVS